VLDLSRAVAGPFAGRILADLGADVVKAELPGTDVAQSYGKVIRGRSGLYSHVNAGKRSILLDLHEPAGVDRLLDLAAACDVLVENFRPGVLDRFGAGWPVLAAANPRLVMLSISGFGQDGADAGRAAYAPVIHAEAGLIGRQADLTGDPPEDIAFALADTLAGLHGTIAILAALRLRDRTGTGQHIDLSMLEAMLATDDYTHYSIDEHPVWPARGEVWPAPGGPILVSADRRYLWRVLKDCFGLADPDPGVSLEQKVRARAQVISAWMAGHPDRDALKRDLDQARLAWADIRHGGDVLAAPSVAGRGTIVEVTDGDGERRSVVRMPYRFSGASSGPPRGVPEPGEHTDAVLRDWTSGPELPYRWSAPTVTRGGSHGTSGADRPQANPGNRRGPGRGIQVARVAGAPQLAQGQRDQPRGGHAGRGRARLPAQRRRPAARRTAVAHHRRAAQRPAPALVRRHAGRPDPSPARRRQAHPAG
jgi:CoA:oxalate CoA-transferase